MANYSYRLPKEPHQGFFFPDPPFQNGYTSSKTKPYTRVRWKCQAFVNKTRYIGNVYLTSEGDENVEKSERFADSVFKSDVDSLDTFRPYRRIDVAAGDGEDITALAIYADRLLEFKQNTLYVINIQGDSEFLEATFKYKGVDGPQAVCETDFGIAWANKQGCYLYTGSGNVQNLIEKNGRRIIALSSDSTPNQVENEPWDNFITNSTAVGYSPQHRKLFVKKAIGAGSNATYGGSNADLYIYDIASGSWTFHYAQSGYGLNDSSDFFVDMNKEMVYWAEETENTNVQLYKWQGDPQDQSAWSIWTKSFDFGDPYQEKRIYKVVIRCRKGGGMPVSISVDGGESSLNVGTLTQGATAGWEECTTNLPINAYQIMVGLNDYSSPVSPNEEFEVYEINIIYRKLKVKGL